MSVFINIGTIMGFALGLLLGVRLGWKGHIRHVEVISATRGIDVRGAGTNTFEACTFMHNDDGIEVGESAADKLPTGD